MKLAESLIDRSEIQKRITDLQNRIRENAVIQQDDAPLEDPAKLFEELIQCYSNLDDLNRRIIATNNSTIFEGNLKVCDALANRESLDKQIKDLGNIASAFSVKNNRFTKTEIKFVSTMNPGTIRIHIDALKDQRKKLDRKIQAMNWAIELLS